MKRIVAAVLLLASIPAFADRQTPLLPNATPASVGLDGAKLKAIDDAVNDAIAARHCPGAVVVLVRQGKVAFRKAYGQRVTEPKEGMTADTLFDLASLTKPIATAASVWHLIEHGKLKLSDPVVKHLPAFGKEKVTVEHLLLHTSGLPAGNAVSAYTDGRKKAIEKICEIRVTAAPGEKFTYSDLGYILLGELVETLSGKALDAFAREHLFEPLGVGLTFRPDDKLKPRCAPTEKEKGEWLRGVVHDPRARALGGVAGHAGLFGTADDVAVFAQMLLDGGTFGKKRIFAAETVKHYTTPRDVPKGQRTPGWDARTSYSSNRGEVFAGYGHTGFTGTSVWIDPPSQMVVVVLTNRVHPDGKGNVTKLRGQIATAAARAIVEVK